MMTPATHQSEADTTFARFLAVSARPLKNEPGLSALAAFDTLQRVHERYADRWLSIWLLCADEYTITPGMPVGKAVHDIEQHGGAVGIVALTVINRTFTFLRKPLRAGREATALLDKSANAAADRFLALAEPLAAKLAEKLREGK